MGLYSVWRNKQRTLLRFNPNQKGRGTERARNIEKCDGNPQHTEHSGHFCAAFFRRPKVCYFFAILPVCPARTTPGSSEHTRKITADTEIFWLVRVDEPRLEGEKLRGKTKTSMPRALPMC